MITLTELSFPNHLSQNPQKQSMDLHYLAYNLKHQNVTLNTASPGGKQ